MSADLYIHAFKEGELVEEDFKNFFCNVIGSRWFNIQHYRSNRHAGADVRNEKIMNTPSVWIGEVSWLKASLLDDSDTYIPAPVKAVSEIIREDLPVIDDALIHKITEGLALSNQTAYDTASQSSVVEFLRKHKGKHIFTVSW